MNAPGIRCTVTYHEGLWRVFAVEDARGPITAEPSPFKNPERGIYVTAFGFKEAALRYVAQKGWQVVT